MTMVEQRRKDGKSPLEALKDGFKAVLCSPAFLYLAEPAPASEAKTPSQSLSAHGAVGAAFLLSVVHDARC